MKAKQVRRFIPAILEMSGWLFLQTPQAAVWLPPQQNVWGHGIWGAAPWWSSIQEVQGCHWEVTVTLLCTKLAGSEPYGVERCPQAPFELPYAWPIQTLELQVCVHLRWRNQGGFHVFTGAQLPKRRPSHLVCAKVAWRYRWGLRLRFGIMNWMWWTLMRTSEALQKGYICPAKNLIAGPSRA